MGRAVPLHDSRDLIVAPATAQGTGAIAIVRMSGTLARECLDRVFHGSAGAVEPGRLLLGMLSNPATGLAIDQCMAVYWESPRSYTGEDMAELHLHGSPAVVSAAIEACQAAGARLAEPGEFTRRAFLNGKMDLAQAEAVADLGQAQTDEARRAALQQLAGELSAQMKTLRAELVDLTAELEARIDFPDEELPVEDRVAMIAKIGGAIGKLDSLIATHRRGRRLQQGARVVLAGPPNAGKSSLFNALVGRERAIVSPHPGTTRDMIEAVVELGGMPVTLVDTAGLRHKPEEIEALGIQKTREEIESADLILFVIDYRERAAAYTEYQAVRERDHLVVFNKAEHLVGVLIGGTSEFGGGTASRLGVHFLSARDRKGLEPLERAVIAHLSYGSGGEQLGVVVTSLRHETALVNARTGVIAAKKVLEENGGEELAVVELTTALSEIDAITGQGALDEDVLDAIFSKFCLGK